MRSRTVETNYSLPRMSSTRSTSQTLLMRFKFHLFRNVLPTIFILLIVGWLSLVLAEQIHLAKKNQRFVLANK